MIKLTKTAVEVPAIQMGTVVPPGSVFVATKDGEAFPGQLEGGKRAVLETAKGSLELTTMSGLRVAVSEEGTYLNQTDRDRLGGAETKPKLRRYTAKDTFGKALSRSGAILLIVTVLGVVAGAAALFVAVNGESATSATEVAERSQTLLSWVLEPNDQAPETVRGNSDPTRLALHRREVVAQRCLKSLGGGEASEAKPGGVTCEQKSPPWWKDKDSGALLGLSIALLTTLLGLFGVGEKFGFGKSPAG